MSNIDATVARLDVNRSEMIEIIEAHSADSALAPDSAAALFVSYSWSTYKPAMGALNSLLLSDLDKVADPALRSAIASWEGALAEARPEQEALHHYGLLVLRDTLARIAAPAW